MGLLWVVNHLSESWDDPPSHATEGRRQSQRCAKKLRPGEPSGEITGGSSQLESGLGSPPMYKP